MIHGRSTKNGNVVFRGEPTQERTHIEKAER